MNDLLATARRIYDAAEAASNHLRRARNTTPNGNLAWRAARTTTGWAGDDLARARLVSGLDIDPAIAARIVSAMETRYEVRSRELAAIVAGDEAAEEAAYAERLSSGDALHMAWAECPRAHQALRAAHLL